MTEFMPVANIADRDAFVPILNYYTSKRNLLVTQKAEQNAINEINNYISQLDTRNKEIKRDDAKKRNAKETRLRQECEIRRQQMIETVKQELDEDKQKKEVIQRELQEVENEVKHKQALMDEYARQIGLPNLQEKQHKLREELDKRPITSCTHPETVYHGYTNHTKLCRCTLCGHVYDDR